MIASNREIIELHPGEHEELRERLGIFDASFQMPEITEAIAVTGEEINALREEVH